MLSQQVYETPQPAFCDHIAIVAQMGPVEEPQKVFVLGLAGAFEQKLTVSKSIRNLMGRRKDSFVNE